jgi:hypothetical protein
MNQQEIKELVNIPFAIDKDKDVIDSKGNLIVDWYLTGNGDTHAINHAINNTYGKGINPESVPDMFNALTLIELNLNGAIDEQVTAKMIRDILKNATL